MFIIGSSKSGKNRANIGCIGLGKYSNTNKKCREIIMEKHVSRKDNQDPDEPIVTYPKTVEYPTKKCNNDHLEKRPQ